MNLVQRTTTIRLLSPGFVGDAQQNAAWRTPPFKAQLRQWWRVAMVAKGIDVAGLRQLEGELFGDAAGKEGNRSRVRLRLSQWKAFPGSKWNEGADARHPGASSAGYLGYGRANTKGGNESAIPLRETAELRIAWPEGQAGTEALDETLGLMHLLGTVGGRSRNGWGSYVLDPAPRIDPLDYSVEWQEAVNDRQWVSGIGRDEKGLLMWRTAPEAGWEQVFGRLAELRKQLCAGAGPLRTLMSYPVTRRKQSAWDNSTRVPNSLRFKVVTGEDGKLRGQVVHLPLRPADELWRNVPQAEQSGFQAMWAAAHALIDEQLERFPS